MASVMHTATAAALDDDVSKFLELVDGRWEAKEIGGVRHSGVCTRLIIHLGDYVQSHRLGSVYGPDTSFQIGKNERMPDVSFLSAARMPEAGETNEICPVAPDLAVEVISPRDLWGKIARKVNDYLAAGVRQVWLISPHSQSVQIYDSPKAISVLRAEDELTNEILLPGFRMRASELFQQPVQS